MRESLQTFFAAFIGMFVISAFTVKWDHKNSIDALKDIWWHYWLLTTNGIFYGLAVMVGRDVYRYRHYITKKINTMLLYKIIGASITLISGINFVQSVTFRSLSFLTLCVIIGTVGASGFIDWIKNKKHGVSKNINRPLG